MARSTSRQRAVWNRNLRRAASSAEAGVRAALVREFARAAENWDAGRHQGNVARIITSGYERTAKATYPTARRMIGGKEARAVDEARVSWLASVRQWITTFALRRARQIARESQRIVTKALADAAAEGQGEASASRLIIDRLSGGLGRRRARTIARTEIGAAQNMALTEAAAAAGISYQLVWCSAEDERTRPSHVAADGQAVDQGEQFQVGDESLARPGDPDGSPSEVINCRCTLLIEPQLDSSGAVVLDN